MRVRLTDLRRSDSSGGREGVEADAVSSASGAGAAAGAGETSAMLLEGGGGEWSG